MSELLQIKRTVLDVGLSKEYKLFQISDMHMACLDNQSTELDVNDHKRFHKQWDSLKRTFAADAGEFCDERYDIEPNLIFDELTKYALEINADALVLSGDIFDRITDSNIRYLKNFISTYPLPVIYCPGNHDWIDEAGEHKNLYHRITPTVKSPECDFFDLGELEVLTFDNGTKHITEYQIEYLKNKLKQDKKLLIVVHAPLNLGEFGSKLVKKMSPYFLMGVDGDCENALEFNRIIAENDSKIIAILAGHIHAFYEEKITNNLMQYTTSSGLIGSGREIIIK